MTHSDAPAPAAVVEPGPATVSAEALRHPVSRKGRKLLDKAQSYTRAGDHFHAVQELNLALGESSAAPYAHGMLGIEYLKIKKIPEAVEELEQAIAAMPRSAGEHSNLGYALCLAGHSEQGLHEFETAVALDQGLLRAHFLKGVVLMDRGSSDHEAFEDLQLAQKEIPAAHLALALFYARHGQAAAAQQQLQEYTGIRTGLTLAKAQTWLKLVSEGPPVPEALGLWGEASE